MTSPTVAGDSLRLPTARPAPGVTRVPSSPSGSPVPGGSAPGEEKVMTLVEHLAELRRRLAISIMAVLLGTAVGFVLAERIIRLFVEFLAGNQVQFLTLSGGFFLQLRIALVVGVLLALPIILYQLWAFVSPGLTEAERRAARPWIPLTIVFFALGEIVAYVTLPYAVTFLEGFALPDVAPSRPSAEAYFGFLLTVFLVFGAVMQFPIALVLLSKLGIVTVDRLRASRRYVALAIVVFAVVVTPGGDPVSPLVMTGVMYLLYELTIVLLRRGERGAAARG